jgi:hypothetical protein
MSSAGAASPSAMNWASVRRVSMLAGSLDRL